MALNINTGLTTKTGEVLTSAYGRIRMSLSEDEQKIMVQMLLYRTEADYLAGRNEIRVDEIPGLRIVSVLTPAQYASINMSTIYNALKNILENGDSDPNYPENAPLWPGLGSSTVVVVMPS
jgi:hypothetical protein